MGIWKSKDELKVKGGLDIPILSTENLGIKKSEYTEYSIIEIFKKEIFDCLANLNESDFNLGLWVDNHALNTKGLSSHLADAMTNQSSVNLDIARVGNTEYLTEAKDKAKAKVNFDYANFRLSDKLKIFYSMQYDELKGLSSKSKSSGSSIVKIEKLSDFSDTGPTTEKINKQMKTIADGLKNGSSVFISDGSSVETHSHDTKQNFESLTKIDQLIAGALSRPLAFINGVGGSSLSDTGESDRAANANARALFFIQHLKPIFIQINPAANRNLQLNKEVKDLGLLVNVLSMIDHSVSLSIDDKRKLMDVFNLQGDFKE